MHQMHLFPLEGSEISDSSVDKGKGSCRPARQYVIKRRISSVVVAPTQDDDSIDDFVKPPPHAKKHTSPKSSTKGGGWRIKVPAKMTISRV
jgi:hypothetical protein